MTTSGITEVLVSDLTIATGIEMHGSMLRSLSAGFAMAIRENLCKYTIQNVMAHIEDYARNGLYLEERYMVLDNYPQAGIHRLEHDRFRCEFDRIRGMMMRMKPGKVLASYEVSVELNRMMFDWIRQHIDDTDKRLQWFLRYGEGKQGAIRG